MKVEKVNWGERNLNEGKNENEDGRGQGREVCG